MTIEGRLEWDDDCIWAGQQGIKKELSDGLSNFVDF